MRFLLQPDVRSSRGRGPGEYSGILCRGPLRASQPGSSVSGVRGHSGLLGGKEARGEEPREEWGQLVHEPGGLAWKGADRAGEREEPRTSPEDTRVRGRRTAGGKAGRECDQRARSGLRPGARERRQTLLGPLFG